jgi:hypothetical protein
MANGCQWRAREPSTGLMGWQVVAERVAAAGMGSDVIENNGGPCRDRTYGPLIRETSQDKQRDTAEQMILKKLHEFLKFSVLL